MTVFLTPAGEPFFGGTYFPPEPRHGLPSFTQLLQAIADAWRERRADIERDAGAITEQLRRTAEPSREPLTASLLSDAVRGLRQQFDPVWGGFGTAPKFPPASALEFLLRRGRARAGDEDAGRNGARWDVRPRRRRLPPLLRRPRVARAALREDAVRQRAARARVSARLARDGQRALPRRSPKRLSTTCCASCGCPKAASPRRRTPTRTASRD